MIATPLRTITSSLLLGEPASRRETLHRSSVLSWTNRIRYAAQNISAPVLVFKCVALHYSFALVSVGAGEMYGLDSAASPDSSIPE